jgi:hypothetical protein
MRSRTQWMLAAASGLLVNMAFAQSDPNAATTMHETSSGAYTTSPNAAPSRSDNSRLAALIPDGMTSEEVCNGFNSLQLCAATLHAAQNLDLPFSDLKRKVSRGEGLSAAIHTLKPQADARAEERRAKDQAQADLD